MNTLLPDRGQSNTPLNSFVTLLHHDQCTNCPLQSQHVLDTKKHKPSGAVAESPFLALSASVLSEEDGEAVSSLAFAEKER